MGRNGAVSFLTGMLLSAVLILGVSGASVFGVPLSVAALAIAAIVFLAARRSSLRPPSWLHMGFLAAFCLGLIPLSRELLAAGIREVVQCFAVFGVAFTLFASAGDGERRPAAITFATLSPLLMLWSLAGRFAGLAMPISDARLSLLLALTFPFLLDVLLRFKRKALALGAAFVLFGIAARHGGLLLCGLVGGVVCVLLYEKKQAPLILPFAILSIALASVATGGSAWQSLSPRNSDTGNLKRLFVEYEATPRAVAAAPVTGHGLGRYKEAIQRYFVRFPDPGDDRIIPDTNSTFALMAVEAGLPAAVLFLALLTAAARGAVARARKEAEASAVAGAALALALSGVFTGVLTRNTGIASAFVLGVAGAVGPRPAALRGWVAKVAAVAAVAIVCLAAPRHHEEPRPGLIILGPEADSAAQYWLVEAEQPSAAPDGAMTIAPANDASGNKVLAIPPEAGKGKGSATYMLDNVPAGPCTVWVRARWVDGCSNSIGCILLGNQIVISDEIFGRWHWVASARRIDLPGGRLELRLQNLEDGVMIDQILLSRDRRFVPHGIMPAAHRDTPRPPIP